MKHQNRIIVGCLTAAVAGVTFGMLIASEDGRIRNTLKAISENFFLNFLNHDVMPMQIVGDLTLNENGDVVLINSLQTS